MLDNTVDSVDATRQASLKACGERLFDAEAALERLDGDEELLAMLVTVFQQDSVELFEQLSTAMARGDLTQIQRAAHSLKGLASNFDAKETADAAFQVEVMASGGATDDLDKRVFELGERLSQLRVALAQWEA